MDDIVLLPCIPKEEQLKAENCKCNQMSELNASCVCEIGVRYPFMARFAKESVSSRKSGQTSVLSPYLARVFALDIKLSQEAEPIPFCFTINIRKYSSTCFENSVSEYRYEGYTITKRNTLYLYMNSRAFFHL